MRIEPHLVAVLGPPLRTEGLTVAYQGRPALWNVTLSLPRSGLTAVVGPNGAGKSTLLKAAVGLVPAVSGTAQVLGRGVGEARREVAYMPQRNSVDWDFPATALDVAAMGLYGRIGWFGRIRRHHREAARDALARVGMADLAERQIGQLSGGQRQRVFLARALAQEARLFLLDEPFAGIDTISEEAILDVLAELERNGRHVVCVHHDLRTVANYFDHVVLLSTTVLASGAPAEVLRDNTIRRAYDTGGFASRTAAAE